MFLKNISKRGLQVSFKRNKKIGIYWLCYFCTHNFVCLSVQVCMYVCVYMYTFQGYTFFGCPGLDKSLWPTVLAAILGFVLLTKLPAQALLGLHGLAVSLPVPLTPTRHHPALVFLISVLPRNNRWLEVPGSVDKERSLEERKNNKIGKKKSKKKATCIFYSFQMLSYLLIRITQASWGVSELPKHICC